MSLRTTAVDVEPCPAPYEAVFELVGAGGATTSARLRGGPSHYTLLIDSLAPLVGFVEVADWQHRASELAGRGHVVDVVHDGRHLLSLGAVGTGARGRRATGSPYIRFGGDPGVRRELATQPAGTDVWVTREEASELVEGLSRRTRRRCRALDAVGHHGLRWVLLADVQRLVGMMGPVPPQR